jgi:hypothetical protein
MKISSLSLNSYIKEILKDNLEKIVGVLRVELANVDFKLSLIGRFTQIDGFYDFIGSSMDCTLMRPLFKVGSHSAFGCVKYGASRFLEDNHSNTNILKRLIAVYRDYF